MGARKLSTSENDPLRIGAVEAPGGGRIGVTFCPGKKDPNGLSAIWDRDLALDLKAVRDWGASTVVCMMQRHEFDEMSVPTLAESVRAAGMDFIHLPIRDLQAPGPDFDAAWREAGPALQARLDRGEAILVHCRGGRGRAGTVAARLLIERGLTPDAAIDAVRAVRPGAIETSEQKAYVRRLPVGIHLARRDRAVGALLGLAVGDAVGTTIEFRERDTYPHLTDMVGGGPFRLEPGEWTDDTSMALCLADSLIAKNLLDPHDLMNRFLRWSREGYNSVNGRCFDIGNATSSALDRFAETEDPMAGDPDPYSAGNGSIMRLAPVAIAWLAAPEAAEAAARLQGQTTHAAAEAMDACALLCRVLMAAISGAGREALVQKPDPGWSPKVKSLARGEWRGRARSAIRSSGYVIDTLEAALWAVDGAPNFREAVLLAANLGGDADTVAAVAGQIAGALHGADAIPPDWRGRLAWSAEIEDRAMRLFSLRPES
jgi:ADP-ribosyl-[dinitrogen reductase] hydrolase